MVQRGLNIFQDARVLRSDKDVLPYMGTGIPVYLEVTTPHKVSTNILTPKKETSSCVHVKSNYLHGHVVYHHVRKSKTVVFW